MNFARLNHILVPDTKEGRDRLRRSVPGRIFGAVAELWFAMTREGKVVLLVAALSGLLGLEVRTRQAYLLWCALCGLLLASYLMRRAYRLVGVRLRVSAPKLVAVGEPSTLTVTVVNEGDREHQAISINGPLLPWDGSYIGSRPVLDRLPPRSERVVEIHLQFVARGPHHLDPVTAEALLPFGLVTSPRLGSEGVRFIVVPRIAPVVSLRTPKIMRYQPGGVALASRTGESMELFGLRPYRQGDPVRDLHARRWARLGIPVVREYRQEYFTRIGIIVDTDARKLPEEHLEAALSLAAGAVAHLSRGEALIDLLVVGTEVHRLTLGRSLGSPDRALELLAMVEPGPVLDTERLARRLEPMLARLSSIVFVALRWDEARRELVDRIARAGVGCRVLEVTARHDEDLGVVDGVDITRLSLATLRAERELAL